VDGLFAMVRHPLGPANPNERQSSLSSRSCLNSLWQAQTDKISEKVAVSCRQEISVKIYRVSTLPCLLLFPCLVLLAWPASGVAQSFTLTASNVSISDQGSSTAGFTLTSVNGYTGQVGVVCIGPNSVLFPELVLPSCANTPQYLTVPANGTVSGSLNFYPPWLSEMSMNRQGSPRPGRKPNRQPLAAVALASVLGIGMRKRVNRWLAMIVVAAASLGAMTGLIGCIGHGGLAMTPGTYTYTVMATSDTLPLGSKSATISVTVHE